MENFYAWIRKFLIEWIGLTFIVCFTSVVVDFGFEFLGGGESFINIPKDFIPVAGALFIGLLTWKLVSPVKKDGD